MEYAIELLKTQLRNELMYHGQAKELLRGSGMNGTPKSSRDAYYESQRLAEERIPQLQLAIEKLTNP